MFRFFASFALIAGLCAGASVSANERAILVLDASGSMWQRLEGRTKVEIARDAVDAMLENWNPNVSLGLIAYGQNRRGDCDDIAILRPAEGFDRDAVSQTVRGLNALGMTPITASVRLAAEQLRYTEQKATVILVSDGDETCKADPCALGKELAAQGIDFTAHVVGFDLPEGPAREQLQCLASSTGGRYLEARNAGQLTAALGEIASVPVTSEPETALDETEWFMPCVDLYESDYESFDMAPGDDARSCQARCAGDDRCDAYTYTAPGWQAEHGKCWLKSGEPLKQNCDLCTSGAKPGVKVFVSDGFVDPSEQPGCAVPATTASR